MSRKRYSAEQIITKLREAEVLQAKHLKELEAENVWLRKVITELTIDNSILKEAARGNF